MKCEESEEKNLRMKIYCIRTKVETGNEGWNLTTSKVESVKQPDINAKKKKRATKRLPPNRVYFYS